MRKKRAQVVPESDNDSDLYHSVDDQKELLALPEVEREQILYERHKESERRRERKEIERKLNSYVLSGSSEEHPWADNGEEGAEAARRWEDPVSKSTFDRFKQAVLRRDQILSILYRTGINRLKGYYVKIRMANGYKLFRIKKVYEGERYCVVSHEKKMSDRWFEIEGSGSRQKISIQNVSNDAAREAEYEEYKEGNKVVSDKEASALWKRLCDETEKPMDSEELEYMLDQKRKFSSDGKLTARQRIELMAALAQAKEEGDLKEAEEIEKKLGAGPAGKEGAACLVEQTVAKYKQGPLPKGNS